MSIDLGDVVRLSYDHQAGGALADAGSATWTVTQPDGTLSGPVPAISTGTGLYRYDYLPVQVGRHTWRWLGTGTNPGAQTGAFSVRSAAPLDLIGLDVAKRALNFPPTFGDDDEELRDAIEAVTAVVEGEDGVGHAVVRQTVVERHDLRGTWAPVLGLGTYPVISLTSVEALGSSDIWSLDDLDVNPETGIVTVLSGVALHGLIRVTYLAGYTAIPPNITAAALLILQDYWQTQRGAKGAPRYAGQRDDEFAASDPPLIPRRARALLGAPLPRIA